jgi:hypothetical protein
MSNRHKPLADFDAFGMRLSLRLPIITSPAGQKHMRYRVIEAVENKSS